jgi:hypothetical protein
MSFIIAGSVLLLALLVGAVLDDPGARAHRSARLSRMLDRDVPMIRAGHRKPRIK